MKRNLFILLSLVILSGCKDQSKQDDQITALKEEYAYMLKDNIRVINRVASALEKNNAIIENNTIRSKMVSDTLFLLMRQNSIVIRSMTEDDLNISLDKLAEMVVKKILETPQKAVAYGEPIDVNELDTIFGTTPLTDFDK